MASLLVSLADALMTKVKKASHCCHACCQRASSLLVSTGSASGGGWATRGMSMLAPRVIASASTVTPVKARESMMPRVRSASPAVNIKGSND